MPRRVGQNAKQAEGLPIDVQRQIARNGVADDDVSPSAEAIRRVTRALNTAAALLRFRKDMQALPVDDPRRQQFAELLGLPRTAGERVKAMFRGNLQALVLNAVERKDWRFFQMIANRLKTDESANDLDRKADPLRYHLIDFVIRATPTGESIKSTLTRIQLGEVLTYLKSVGVTGYSEDAVRKALRALSGEKRKAGRPREIRK